MRPESGSLVCTSVKKSRAIRHLYGAQVLLQYEHCAVDETISFHYLELFLDDL